MSEAFATWQSNAPPGPKDREVPVLRSFGRMTGYSDGAALRTDIGSFPNPEREHAADRCRSFRVARIPPGTGAKRSSQRDDKASTWIRRRYGKIDPTDLVANCHGVTRTCT